MRAKEITEARIGPTHGVHKSPKENPTNNPEPKPFLPVERGASPVSREKIFSMNTWNCGTRSDIPKTPMTTTANKRSVSADMSSILTSVERNSVNRVKLATNPTITPSGRARPISSPPKLDERISGRIGRIQGESTVTTPAKNAKVTRSNILI